MLLPKFTAEASIGNHESYADAKGKYKKYDSSVKIEPAESLEVCESRGCFWIVGTGTYACGYKICDRYENGRLVEYQYWKPGGHLLVDWIDWGPISEQ